MSFRSYTWEDYLTLHSTFLAWTKLAGSVNVTLDVYTNRIATAEEMAALPGSTEFFELIDDCMDGMGERCVTLYFALEGVLEVIVVESVYDVLREALGFPLPVVNGDTVQAWLVDFMGSGRRAVL